MVTSATVGLFSGRKWEAGKPKYALYLIGSPCAWYKIQNSMEYMMKSWSSFPPLPQTPKQLFALGFLYIFVEILMQRQSTCFFSNYYSFTSETVHCFLAPLFHFRVPLRVHFLPFYT